MSPRAKRELRAGLAKAMRGARAATPGEQGLSDHRAAYVIGWLLSAADMPESEWAALVAAAEAREPG